MGKVKKLDGVGPIDNRPSTDLFHPFWKQKLKCLGRNFGGSSAPVKILTFGAVSPSTAEAPPIDIQQN